MCHPEMQDAGVSQREINAFPTEQRLLGAEGPIIFLILELGEPHFSANKNSVLGKETHKR